LREREEEDRDQDERDDRDDRDDDDDCEKRTSDGRLICDGCDGSGYCPGCDSGACPCHGSGILEDPDEDFDDVPSSGWNHWHRGEGNNFGGDPVDKIQRQATTSTESSLRRDIPDSLPELRAKRQQAFDTAVAEYEQTLKNAYKGQS
jgi:hypothetical protein